MGQTKKVVNRKTVYLDPIALESRRNVVRPLPYHVVSSDIPPRLVDYSDFANGKALGTKFPFAGFPVLAQELCDWLSIQPLEAITIKKIRSMFYKLFCYFTELELNNKTSFSILSRAHFTQFPKWCEKRMEKKVGATHQNLKYIYELRKHFGVSEEFYGTVRTPTTNPVAIPTDIRKEIVKSVRSSAAKVVSKWLSINRVFEKGIDDDPIIQNYKTSADRRTWDDEKYIQMAEAARGEKIATPVNWLAKPELMPTSTYFTRGDVLLCMKYFCENYNDFPSPQNLKNELAQLAKLNARSFDIAKFPLVRLGEYFYGDSEDIGILATEILIQTGWNWQTLRELDPFDYRLNPTSSNQRVTQV